MNYKTRLIGQRFGQLEVIDFYGIAKGNKTIWLCVCSCGKQKTVRNDSLIQGTTKSCGCLNTKKGKESKGWKGHEEIYGSYWSRIEWDARKRNIPFQISIEYAWGLFLKQNRKCALSGEELVFGDKDSRTASLDRIDSSKGYIEGNVQWVTKRVNFAKQESSQEEFIKMCHKVSQLHR